MGVEVLSGLVSSLTTFRVSGISNWLAVIGFSIIVIVAAGYGVYGIYRLVKWAANMRIKEFTLLLVAIGAAMIGAAIALP